MFAERCCCLYIGRSDSSQCHCLQLLAVQAYSHHQDPSRTKQPWTPPPAPHRDSPHSTALWWCTDGRPSGVSGGVLYSWCSAGRRVCGRHTHCRVSRRPCSCRAILSDLECALCIASLPWWSYMCVVAEKPREHYMMVSVHACRWEASNWWLSRYTHMPHPHATPTY